jgi:hypothetical protein
MPCAIREQLVKDYLEFTLRDIEVRNAVAEKKSEEWTRATEETRKQCTDALEALNQHRREHGC